MRILQESRWQLLLLTLLFIKPRSLSSLEPLPPNARMSIWASKTLPDGSGRVTAVSVLPGEIRDRARQQQATPDKLVLHSSISKSTSLFTAESRSSGLTRLPSSYTTPLEAVACHPSSGFVVYSHAEGCVSLPHPAHSPVDPSPLSFQPNVGTTGDTIEPVGTLALVGEGGGVAIVVVGCRFFAYGGSGEGATAQPPTLLYTFPR